MISLDQPTATLLYLGLYLLTLVLHVLSMNYVLAGQSYLAFMTGLEAVRGPLPSQAAPAAKLRDWLPFALGVTITAGVAPLLFVQILYKRPFYTANLLLFHRWMAILPVLIVAFYLLYLQKSGRWSGWSARLRAAISIGIWACFAFVAWSWTENHLLSLRSQAEWAAEYASARLFFHDVELFPRLAVWFCGGFPVLATALGWQLMRDGRQRSETSAGESSTDERRLADRTARVLAAAAMVMLVAAIGAAGVYLTILPNDVRIRFSAEGMPLAWVAAAGMAMQTEAWRRILTRGKWSSGVLALATLGAVLAVSAGTLLRELRRTAALPLVGFVKAHVKAGQVGGVGVFFLFLMINTFVIYAAVLLVRRGLRSAPSATVANRPAGK